MTRKYTTKRSTRGAWIATLILPLTLLGLCSMLLTFIGCTIAVPIAEPYSYEQHKEDVKTYRLIENLEGMNHQKLQDMWGTMYIEARLNNELIMGCN